LTALNDGTDLGGSPPAELTGPGDALDRCAVESGWLILAFHQISVGHPLENTQISQAAFATIMKAIEEHGIQVVTIAQALANFT
jgi:hypothetical protein